jgi:hypothetical protein
VPRGFSPALAAQILFLDEAGTRADVARCLEEPEPHACLLALRYEGDPEASRDALALYERSGDLVGLETDRWFDGGYRGRLHLVPVVPKGAERRHLAYIAGAARDFDGFFDALAARAGRPPDYRWRHLAFRVFRSIGARTPSAFAQGSTIGYNVAGSLNVSADAVRETLFHEVFHLNDADRGGWSARELGPTYSAIRARCGVGDEVVTAKLGAWTECLRPFAPSDTLVRGGTYYAFQPGNGVEEYAAELALRYYKETRARLGQGAFPRKPFRCGPPENRRTWDALASTFFAGADLTPPCP